MQSPLGFTPKVETHVIPTDFAEDFARLKEVVLDSVAMFREQYGALESTGTLSININLALPEPTRLHITSNDDEDLFISDADGSALHFTTESLTADYGEGAFTFTADLQGINALAKILTILQAAVLASTRTRNG